MIDLTQFNFAGVCIQGSQALSDLLDANPDVVLDLSNRLYDKVVVCSVRDFYIAMCDGVLVNGRRNSTTGCYEINILGDIVACVTQLNTVPVVTGGGGGPSADIEYVCNSDTNTYDRVVTPIDNGVAGAPVITATAIPCSQPAPAVLTQTQCYDDDTNARFTVKIYSDATEVATDVLGNLVDITGGIPVNWTLVDCATCPEQSGDVIGEEFRFDNITGPQAFTFPVDTVSFSIIGKTIANGSTIIDSAGNTSALVEGLAASSSTSNPDGSGIYTVPPTVNIAAGDVVCITYNTLAVLP